MTQQPATLARPARAQPPRESAREQLVTSLLVMAWLVEARDPYTGGHLWRVSRYARLLAEDAGLADEDIARITVSAFLHDLGKISIPDAVLRKPGHLTAEEYDVIRTHPEAGARLLAGHPLRELVTVAVLSHHETPDGRGYPQGLAGAEIPLDARIVGIGDAFDAMTSARPYRRGMDRDAALAIIESGLGTQFDRNLGLRFLALGRAGAFDHIIGHSDEGIPLRDCPMCGPTLVLRRGQRADSLVYCRNCGGEFRVEQGTAGLEANPTGGRGSARELAPAADLELIADLIRNSMRLFTAATAASRTAPRP